MKLLKFEEELAQRHMIQWTNYEIARNQAKMYEVGLSFKLVKMDSNQRRADPS